MDKSYEGEEITFLAAAHLRSSTIAADSFQYGEQVAHLRVASQAVDQALKSKSMLIV